MSDQVILKKGVVEGVALITINRPEKRNPLSLEVMTTITQMFEDFKTDDSVRVVITTGAGDAAYVGGLDANELATLWIKPDAPREPMPNLISALRNSPKVTIAAVNGYCLGGGMNFLMAHDLAIASAEKAQIGLPEIFRGFVPRFAEGALFKYLAPRIILEILLTGHNFDAHRSLAVGMINKVVPHKQLMEEAYKWGKEIASYDPLTLKYCKKAAYECMDQLTFDQMVRMSELNHLEHNFVNPRHFEGITAFTKGKGIKANF